MTNNTLVNAKQAEKIQPKLKFKRTVMAYKSCFVANNYKVVKYGDHYYAYYAVDLTKDGKYIWGDSCYRTAKGSVQYKTAKEAMRDCQRHLDTADKAWNYTTTQ